MSTDTLRAPAGATAPEVAAPSFAPPALLRERGLRLAGWGALAALGVLILVSLWLRVRSIHLYYWVDEGLSVGISSHPLSKIPALLHQDGSPPLYYLLLHVWMSLRGKGEVATHELSLIFALLTIPVAYWAGASLFDRRAGLISAVLAAGAPYLTVYAQETRMYALLALLALLVAASFVHVFVLRNRRHIPVFVISLAAALYTHNWALFLGLMAGVAFLLCVRESPRAERRALWIDGAVAFGGVAVLYAPWVPTLLYQAGHTGAPWDLAPVFWSITQGLYSLVGGRGAAVALLLAGGTGLLALRSAPAKSRVVLAVSCMLVLGIGTLLVAWAYSKVTPAWANRYLAVIVGPLILLFGLGLSRAGRLGLVALVLVCGFWVLDPIPTSLAAKSNVASVIGKLRPHLASDMLVLSTQPEQVPVLDYYLRGRGRYATPLGLVADPRVVNWRDALGRFRRSPLRSTPGPLLRSLTPGQRVLLVTPVGLPKSPLWMVLIQRASTRWSSVLDHDPSLKLVASSAAKVYSAGVAVEGAVYVVR
jgi:mannosyltransferase